MKLYKCFMCCKKKFGENSGKYMTMHYPKQKKDGYVLAIEFVCHKCISKNGQERILERLKRDEKVTIYDLERLGLIKKLKGKLQE